VLNKLATSRGIRAPVFELVSSNSWRPVMEIGR
jgi:hypothetical protein